MTDAEILRNAFVKYTDGRLSAAERACRTIIMSTPNNANAYHLLGVIRMKQRRTTEAAELIGQAVVLDGTNAFAYNNLGIALASIGRFDEAVDAYLRAQSIAPNFAEASKNLGSAYLAVGRYEEAVAGFDGALKIAPSDVEALNSRGVALLNLHRPQEALASFDQLLQIFPGHVSALNNRGNALAKVNRYEEALESYDLALGHQADHPEIMNNRCAALIEIRRYDEALLCCNRILEVSPQNASALAKRGLALQHLTQFSDALDNIERALSIDPNNVEFLHWRANFLFERQAYGAAIGEFERLLRIQPSYKYARGAAQYSRLHCCEWNDFSDETNGIAADIGKKRRTIAPFAFLSMSDSAALQRQCAEIYAKDNYPYLPQRSKPDFARRANIHIAYMSADFGNHPTARLIVDLLETHDKRQFGLTAISLGPIPEDEFGIRLMRPFDRHIDVRKRSDREVAALIGELQVDILVDLMGYTHAARPGILAWRPAPIQVNYLGYPGTMGANFIDYIIADRFIIPDAERRSFSENIVYMPDTYQPNDIKLSATEPIPSREQLGLPSTGFVFCSFNNTHKITPTLFDIWMELLRQVEGSVLWLLECTEQAVHNLSDRATIRGVDPNRIFFAPRVALEDHLARQVRANLFLDSFPFGAHSTASVALWAGLPLVTCVGSSFASRVAGSLLTSIGLPDLVTENLRDYQILALKLAQDAIFYEETRKRIAQNKVSYPLFNTARLCGHIETAYHEMWRRYEAGEPPASFAVAGTDIVY